MRILIPESYKALSKFKASEAKQVTWHRVGTFQTSFLKKFFLTLKQTGIEAVDVELDGKTVIITYPRGVFKLNSEPVVGDVHLFKPWFDLGGTPECNETEIQDRQSPEYRRASFQVIQGGAA